MRKPGKPKKRQNKPRQYSWEPIYRTRERTWYFWTSCEEPTEELKCLSKAKSLEGSRYYYIHEPSGKIYSKSHGSKWYYKTYVLKDSTTTTDSREAHKDNHENNRREN